MQVSVLIVNYKTAELVVNAINSIKLQTYGISYEIIVADNHSQDNLRSLIESSFGEEVKIIDLPENIGFGRANNAAAKIAKGEYLFFLNPDTYLMNNTIKILYDAMQENDNIGGAGGNLYDKDNHPMLSFRRFLPGLFWEINEFFNLLPEKLLYKKNTKFNHSDKPIKVGYITGADLMVKHTLFNSLGGFCPKFFMYYEDTDLCYRISKTGKKILCIPEAKTEHLEGASQKSDDRKINKFHIENVNSGRKTYLALHFNAFHRSLINLFYLMTLLSRSILLKKSLKRDEWRYRLKLFFKR